MTPADPRSPHQTLQEALGDLERLAERHTENPNTLARIRAMTSYLEADLSFLINPQQIIQRPIKRPA